MAPAPKKQEEKKQVDVVDIVRHGEKMILPEDMTLPRAIAVLQRQMEYEEETVVINETISGFIWDGALALQKAFTKKFGWVSAEPIPGFFGSTPPQLISIEIGYGKTTQVPWGRFSLPGIDGYVQTGTNIHKGRFVFQFSASVKRKHTAVIADIARLTREFLRDESIYRSQAIQIDFRNPDGSVNEMPMPNFMDLNGINPKALIFSDDVDTQISTNIFTPITKTLACEMSKIPLKRGVLLAGKYGTGKTLAAKVTAKHAVDNGWTFIYIKSPAELPEAIIFAKDYEPAVIFSEDIDRAAARERTNQVNDILNTLDGIDTKNSKIMVILTTNHLDQINEAMFRPGRLDAVITISPPDAKAAIRLVQQYAGSQLQENEDLTIVGTTLAGQIPAVIREAVERAKLYEINLRTNDQLAAVNYRPQITSQALLAAAQGMNAQLKLLSPTPPETNDPHQAVQEQLAERIALRIKSSEVHDKLTSIKTTLESL